jgi:hypothetical protein
MDLGAKEWSGSSSEGAGNTRRVFVVLFLVEVLARPDVLADVAAGAGVFGVAPKEVVLRFLGEARTTSSYD